MLTNDTTLKRLKQTWLSLVDLQLPKSRSVSLLDILVHGGLSESTLPQGSPTSTFSDDTQEHLLTPLTEPFT